MPAHQPAAATPAPLQFAPEAMVGRCEQLLGQRRDNSIIQIWQQERLAQGARDLGEIRRSLEALARAAF